MRDCWLRQPIGARRYRPWLSERGSLTKRLQQHSTEFSVQPLCLVRQKPPFAEIGLLPVLPRQHALLRDVVLRCDGEAVVFAHSVLPQGAMRGAWRGLGRLGAHSLGGTLFADRRMCREELQYKKISAQHFLFKRAAEHVTISGKSIWARRSVFRLGRNAVLVTELFLPAVLALNGKPNKK